MEAAFWYDKWQRGDIAFHLEQANPLLVAHVAALRLAPGSRVFLPLCGKTKDIAWLLAQGYRVAGAELSELAISELFRSLGVEPVVSTGGELLRYECEGLTVFVGDLFALTRDALGPVDAVYDRAALVALPVDTRERYAAHLAAITACAPQLLVAYEYDQSQIDGPPFSVIPQEVARLYAAHYRLAELACCPVEGGLKGRVPAVERVWLLQRDEGAREDKP